VDLLGVSAAAQALAIGVSAFVWAVVHVGADLIVLLDVFQKSINQDDHALAGHGLDQATREELYTVVAFRYQVAAA